MKRLKRDFFEDHQIWGIKLMLRTENIRKCDENRKKTSEKELRENTVKIIPMINVSN